MGESSAEVRHEIEMTRDQMSGTIDAIADRTSPSRIVGRQRQRMSHRARRVRESVMGSAEDAYGAARDRTVGMAEAAGHGVQVAADEVRSAPDAVKRQTQGSPLAAGLIAFGVGALAAAIFPSTQTERRAASRLQEEAQPAMQQLKEAGQQVAHDVKDSAQQAVQEVKSTATDAAHQVGEEAKDAAQDVQSHAKATAERVGAEPDQAGPEGRSGNGVPRTRTEL